jgi:hypothetical protein
MHTFTVISSATKVPRAHDKERKVSSKNTVGKIGYPHAKE